MQWLPGILRWLSEWSTVLAPIGGAVFAVWRFVLLPKLVRPARARQRQRRARELRMDQSMDRIDLIHAAIGPNGGKSILDRIMQLQATVGVAAARQALLSDFYEHPLFEADRDGQYTRINVAFERFSGYANVEVRGFGWKNFIHEADRDRVAKEWGHAVRDRRAFRVDFRFITKSNLTHKVQMHARPAIDDASQMVTTWMGSVVVLVADRSAA